MSETEKIVYSLDASTAEGSAGKVFYPRTKGEVQNIVKKALKEKKKITPRGGGTGLSGGAVPQGSWVLDMSGMNKIIEVGKNYVKTEAGVVLDDLNFELEKNGRFFPVIPASHSAAEIGGMVSENASGLRAVKYGKTSDWVLELEAVTGKGEIIRTKNTEEFAGSEGTLGVITSLKLKTAPKIGKTTISVFEFDDCDKLMEKVLELKEEKGLIALEFVSKMVSPLLDFPEKNHLIAEFENNRGEIKDKKEKERLWKLREGAGPVLIQKGLPVLEDPRIPLSRMAEFLRWLEKEKIPAFGHIGEGIIHPHFGEGSEKREKMYEKVKKLGGEVSGEHGIGILKKEYAEKERKDRIKRLKEKYDPEGIMNRGKII